MKKFLFFIFLAFIPLTLKADSLENIFDDEIAESSVAKGNVIFDLGIGGEYFSYGAHREGIKTGALLINLRALYAVDDYINIGLEGIFGRGGMGGGTAIPYGSEYDSPWFIVKKEDNYYDNWAVMFATRVNFNPKDSNRFYMPLGVGYMEMDQITEYKAYSLIIPGQSHEFKEEKKIGGGIALYGGLGWEYDFGGFIFGLESRFTAFKFGAKYVEGISLLARLGIKL